VNLQQLLCLSSFLLSFTGRAPSSWRGLDESSSRLRGDWLQAGALVLQSHLLLKAEKSTQNRIFAAKLILQHKCFVGKKAVYNFFSCSPNQFLTAPGRVKLKYKQHRVARGFARCVSPVPWFKENVYQCLY